MAEAMHVDYSMYQVDAEQSLQTDPQQMDSQFRTSQGEPVTMGEQKTQTKINPEEFFDAVLVFAIIDYDLAFKTQAKLSNLILENGEKPKICLYIEEKFGGSDVKLPDVLLDKCGLILLLLTEHFKDDPHVEFVLHQMIGDTRLFEQSSLRKKYCVRQLHTRPRHSRNYGLPSGMAAIRAYNVFDWDDRKYHQKLLTDLLQEYRNKYSDRFYPESLSTTMLNNAQSEKKLPILPQHMNDESLFLPDRPDTESTGIRTDGRLSEFGLFNDHVTAISLNTAKAGTTCPKTVDTEQTKVMESRPSSSRKQPTLSSEVQETELYLSEAPELRVDEMEEQSKETRVIESEKEEEDKNIHEEDECKEMEKDADTSDQVSGSMDSASSLSQPTLRPMNKAGDSTVPNPNSDLKLQDSSKTFEVPSNLEKTTSISAECGSESFTERMLLDFQGKKEHPSMSDSVYHVQQNYLEQDEDQSFGGNIEEENKDVEESYNKPARKLSGKEDQIEEKTDKPTEGSNTDLMVDKGNTKENDNETEDNGKDREGDTMKRVGNDNDVEESDKVIVGYNKDRDENGKEEESNNKDTGGNDKDTEDVHINMEGNNNDGEKKDEGEEGNVKHTEEDEKDNSDRNNRDKERNQSKSNNKDTGGDNKDGNDKEEEENKKDEEDKDKEEKNIKNDDNKEREDNNKDKEWDNNNTVWNNNCRAGNKEEKEGEKNSERNNNGREGNNNGREGNEKDKEGSKDHERNYNGREGEQESRQIGKDGDNNEEDENEKEGRENGDRELVSTSGNSGLCSEVSLDQPPSHEPSTSKVNTDAQALVPYSTHRETLKEADVSPYFGTHKFVHSRNLMTAGLAHYKNQGLHLSPNNEMFNVQQGFLGQQECAEVDCMKTEDESESTCKGAAPNDSPRKENKSNADTQTSPTTAATSAATTIVYIQGSKGITIQGGNNYWTSMASQTSQKQQSKRQKSNLMLTYPGSRPNSSCHSEQSERDSEESVQSSRMNTGQELDWLPPHRQKAQTATVKDQPFPSSQPETPSSGKSGTTSDRSSNPPEVELSTIASDILHKSQGDSSSLQEVENGQTAKTPAAKKSPRSSRLRRTVARLSCGLFGSRKHRRRTITNTSKITS